MKKIILILLLLLTSTFAEVTNQYASQALIDSKTPIVDIRTPDEWRETGLIKGAIPIMFFTPQGKYDVNKFLKELNEKVDTTKPFALICRTGSRTKLVAEFLAKELHYPVIDLVKGMLVVDGLKLPKDTYK